MKTPNLTITQFLREVKLKWELMVDQQLQGIYVNAHMDLNLKIGGKVFWHSWQEYNSLPAKALPSKATLSQERLAAAAANAEQ